MWFNYQEPNLKIQNLKELYFTCIKSILIMEDWRFIYLWHHINHSLIQALIEINDFTNQSHDFSDKYIPWIKGKSHHFQQGICNFQTMMWLTLVQPNKWLHHSMSRN